MYLLFGHYDTVMPFTNANNQDKIFVGWKFMTAYNDLVCKIHLFFFIKYCKIYLDNDYLKKSFVCKLSIDKTFTVYMTHSWQWSRFKHYLRALVSFNIIVSTIKPFYKSFTYLKWVKYPHSYFHLQVDCLP